MNASFSTSGNSAFPHSAPTLFLPYPAWLIAFLWILTCIFCIETTLGNLLVLCAYKLERNIRRHLSNKFIVSLAVSDLIIGMEGFPMLTIYVVEREHWPLGDIMCKVWLCVDYTLCLVSILTVLLITVDRYCSVCYPASYRAWQTPKKVQLMIVLSWIVPFVLFAIMIFGWEMMTKKKNIKDPEKCSAPFLSDPYVNMSMYIAYYWTTLAAMSVLYRGIHKAAKTLEQKGKAREKQTIALLLGQRCMAQVGVGILMQADSQRAKQEQMHNNDKIEYSKFQQDYGPFVQESGYITAVDQNGDKTNTYKDLTLDNIEDSGSIEGLRNVNKTNNGVKIPNNPIGEEKYVDEGKIRKQSTSLRMLSSTKIRSLEKRTSSSLPIQRTIQQGSLWSSGLVDNESQCKSEQLKSKKHKTELSKYKLDYMQDLPLTRVICKGSYDENINFNETKSSLFVVDGNIERSENCDGPKGDEQFPIRQSFNRNMLSNFSLQLKRTDSFCSSDLWGNGSSSANNSLFADITFASILDFDQTDYQSKNVKRIFSSNQQLNDFYKVKPSSEKLIQPLIEDSNAKSYGTCPTLTQDLKTTEGNPASTLLVDDITNTDARRLSSSTTAPVAINKLVSSQKRSLDQKRVSMHWEDIKPNKMTYRDSWQAVLCHNDKVRLMKMNSAPNNASLVAEDEESVATGSIAEEFDEPPSIVEKRTGSWVTTLFTNPTWLIHKKRKVTKAEKRARKAFRTITVIVGTFALFWSPYFIVATIYGFCPKCVPSPLFFTSYYLCYLNSSVNPFAYAFANRLFRKTFVRILRGDFRRT